MIRIDLGSGDFSNRENIVDKITVILKEIQEELEVPCEPDLKYDNCLALLIKQAYKKYQQKVVILMSTTSPFWTISPINQWPNRHAIF